MTFHSVGKFISPIDFHSMICQRGRWLNHQPYKQPSMIINGILHHIKPYNHPIFFG